MWKFIMGGFRRILAEWARIMVGSSDFRISKVWVYLPARRNQESFAYPWCDAFSSGIGLGRSLDESGVASGIHVLDLCFAVFD